MKFFGFAQCVPKLLGLVWLCTLVTAARAEVVLAMSPNMGSLPIYVAQEQGMFTSAGVTVRVLDCALGRICLEQMLQGAAQLATAADLPLAIAIASGRPFSVLATINSNRHDTKIVTRRGSGIVTTADLTGRTVGTFIGTTAQYALESQLLVEGIDIASVRLLQLEPEEGRRRMLGRTLDAVALFEPHAFDVVQALGGEAVVLDTKRTYTQTWNLVAAPAPQGPSQAELSAVLRALDQASRVIAEDPGYAKAVLRRRLRLNAELVDQSWASLGYDLGLRQSLITTIEGQVRWATRKGTIKGAAPNVLDWIDARPLRQVRPDRVTLAH